MSASSSSNHGSRHIDAGLYKAAANGIFEPFKNYAEPLDHVRTRRNKNTILHIHLNSPHGRSEDFVEKVLCQCPQLLWQMNNDGDIPLHIAAKYAHLEIVKLLIEEAKKPIHRDLETGQEEVVRRMLRLRNNQHETALHLASSRSECLCVVTEILEHEDSKFTYSSNKCGESPLYQAANEHNNAAAFEILNKFESPDCSGPNLTTVFHAAVILDSLDDRCFDLMLSKVGSFVSQADENGWTPLHYAAYLGKPIIVRKILETDTSSAYAVDKERNRTALHLASIKGEVEIMKEIIDKCPDCCEITDFKGWNVLHFAVISKCEDAVKVITRDSSLAYLVNGQDAKGFTPMYLFMASDKGLNWIFLVRLAAPPKFLRREFDEEEIAEWVKNLGEDPFGKRIAIQQSWGEIQNEIAEKVIPELEKAKDSHLVAAALVATVTFAAAFTLPGGYISDENDSKLKGTPILSRNTAFRAFVINDAMAMVLSTTSVLIHFIMVLFGYKQRYYWLIRTAFWFVVLAMGAMVVAFVTGTYAVLAPNSIELAITASIIGLSFFVHVFYASIRLIYDFIKSDRSLNPGTSIAKSLDRLLHSAPRHLSCGG